MPATESKIINIDWDEEGRATFPENFRNRPGRYNVRKPGPKFWDWEKEATTHLQSLGYTVGNWFTIDGDDFGPLTRGVDANKDGVNYSFWYG